MPPFQGGTFNHSAISPRLSRAFLNLPQLKAGGALDNILGSLRADVLFHICSRSQIDRNTLREISAKGRRIAPVDLPPVVDHDEDVLPWNDVGQIEAAVAIGLVAAQNP